MVHRAWDLLWRCKVREEQFAEAPSVQRRWDEDLEAYTSHMDWISRSGLRRSRQTPRQAAMTLRKLEEAKRILDAEEACDDPLRMIPYLIQQKAVSGEVVAVNRDFRELATTRIVSRPLVTLHSPDECLMPLGKELWWSEQPSGREYVVHSIRRAPGQGWLITLKLMTGSASAALPAIDSKACFSVHNTCSPPFLTLPTTEPWTHRPAQLIVAVESIEEENEE
jgi:hypothetical protein